MGASPGMRDPDPTRLASLREEFTQVYGRSPTHLVWAPARAEVLGNHTDYNEGLTLSVNLDNAGILALAVPREDGVSRLRSRDVAGEVWLEAATLHTRGSADIPSWGAYARGVALALSARGRTVSGMDVLLESTIPAGGLSSSAALETALCRLWCTLGALPLSAAEQVKVCHEAESQHVGVPCGFLDQATIGLADSLLQISYRSRGGALPLECSPVQAELAPYQFVVGFDPESTHALVDGKYAARRQGCERAVAELGHLLDAPLRALRDVSPSQLHAVYEALSTRVGAEVAGFAQHVVEENARVELATEALLRGDLPQLGAQMSLSGQSALDLYHLDEDAPELRIVLEAAREHLGEGVLGVRNMGGGFNATTLSLIHRDSLERYRSEVSRRYEMQVGRDYQMWGFGVGRAARMRSELLELA